MLFITVETANQTGTIVIARYFLRTGLTQVLLLARIAGVAFGTHALNCLVLLIEQTAATVCTYIVDTCGVQ